MPSDSTSLRNEMTSRKVVFPLAFGPTITWNGESGRLT